MRVEDFRFEMVLTGPGVPVVDVLGIVNDVRSFPCMTEELTENGIFACQCVLKELRLYGV